MEPKTKPTIEAGIPVGDDRGSWTAGPRGPLWVQD
jgi:catalase